MGCRCTNGNVHLPCPQRSAETQRSRLSSRIQRTSSSPVLFSPFAPACAPCPPASVHIYTIGVLRPAGGQPVCRASDYQTHPRKQRGNRRRRCRVSRRRGCKAVRIQGLLLPFTSHLFKWGLSFASPSLFPPPSASSPVLTILIEVPVLPSFYLSP